MVSTSKSHSNITLAEDIGSGSKPLPIPAAVGQYSTILKTMQGVDPMHVLDATTFAFLVVAWDEDGLTDSAIESGRTALVAAIKKGLIEKVNLKDLSGLSAAELDAELKKISAEIETGAKEAAKNAIKAAEHQCGKIFLQGGGDDLLGTALQLYSFADLEAGGGSIPIQLHLKGDDAH